MISFIKNRHIPVKNNYLFQIKQQNYQIADFSIFNGYLSNIIESSLNDLNSRAFPLGSLTNIVHCSPLESRNLVFGFIIK